MFYDETCPNLVTNTHNDDWRVVCCEKCAETLRQSVAACVRAVLQLLSGVTRCMTNVTI